MDLAITIITGLIRAFALSYLWSALAPQFGLPDLGVAQAFGALLIVSLVHGIDSDEVMGKSEKTAEQKQEASLIGLMWSLIALGFGWVTVQFL